MILSWMPAHEIADMANAKASKIAEQIGYKGQIESPTNVEDAAIRSLLSFARFCEMVGDGNVLVSNDAWDALQ